MRIKIREGSSPKEIVFMGEKKGKRYLKDSHDSRSLFATRNRSDKKEVLLDSRIHINTLLYESAHTKKEKKLLGKKGWICNPSRLERNR